MCVCVCVCVLGLGGGHCSHMGDRVDRGCWLPAQELPPPAPGRWRIVKLKQMDRVVGAGARGWGARRKRGGRASRRPDKGGGRAARGTLSALADRAAGRAPAACVQEHKGPGPGGGWGTRRLIAQSSCRRGEGAGPRPQGTRGSA